MQRSSAVALALAAGLAGLTACGRQERPAATGADPARSLDLAALEAHVAPTADHPATLVNFWATW